ncbi:uncharacterized protein LOC119688908 [Teleopsis dalmanni]|uniref:uncharacterized protein LOC119688908 n=1 Tax=Teleopsis dalmanni TaxID=139649 RepID=UPI0018CCC19A|nr:uncharacterized protein LOC119688908 [Teleopsis dalmanni]
MSRLEVRNLFLGKLQNCIDSPSQPQYKACACTNPHYFNTTKKSSARKRQPRLVCDANRVKRHNCYTFSDIGSETCDYAEYSTHSSVRSESYKTEDYLSDSISFIASSKCSKSTTKSENGKRSHDTNRAMISPSSANLRETAKSKCKISAVIDDTIKELSSSKKSDGKEVKHKTCSSSQRIKHSPTASEKAKLKPSPKEQKKELIKEKETQIVKQEEKSTTTRKSDEIPSLVESDETDVGSLCYRCGIEVAKENAMRMKQHDSDNILSLRKADHFLTISVDDVVNTKVINPMIRKMQRMYINSLKEEMSLLEDLELLPQRVNEVYKDTIFNEQSNSN